MLYTGVKWCGDSLPLPIALHSLYIYLSSCFLTIDRGIKNKFSLYIMHTIYVPGGSHFPHPTFLVCVWGGGGGGGGGGSHIQLPAQTLVDLKDTLSHLVLEHSTAHEVEIE